MPSRDRL
ncbi:hypothetical protein EYZ11_013306 [Aspergillus tanneri]|nr:hypothetical protein EYZ11_013306 [Aspergillus tanneri]